jgi:NADPH:quinone reductase-like Zn-dependent oxidoreductase
MRAALIKAFGEPTEVLELADVPEPLGPAAGEALVGVEYAPVNMNACSTRFRARQAEGTAGLPASHPVSFSVSIQNDSGLPQGPAGASGAT